MIKSRLFYKISAGFIAIVLLSLLIVGLFFINLFKNYSFEEKERSMLNRAREITTIAGLYQSGSIGSESYEEFIEVLDSFSGARIWVTDQRGNMMMMSRGQNCPRMGNGPHMGAFGDMDLIESVLKGKEVMQLRYSKFYAEPMIVVGTPIYDSSKKVIGTVFMHSPVENITATLDKANRFLLIAILISVLITGILGVFYSRYISRPLQRMNHTALQMAEGNYEVRTNIRLKDEIGQLSGSIDHLAERLSFTVGEVERLEQMRKDLISNVSHEFRTPLTLIRGSVETLIDGAVNEPAEVDKQYKRILHETKGLERLVNDLLDLGRLQSGRFDFRFEDIDIVSLVKEVTRSLQSIASNKNIKIETETEGIIAPVRGDYYRLRQLMVIFLDNSIKFSDSGSNIHIELKAAEAVRISIKDEGIGISKEDMPYIWERFYKVNKFRGKSDSGSGLGLAIAKYIIDAHHGKVSIESELGKGTTVEVELPIA